MVKLGEPKPGLGTNCLLWKFEALRTDGFRQAWSFSATRVHHNLLSATNLEVNLCLWLMHEHAKYKYMNLTSQQLVLSCF